MIIHNSFRIQRILNNPTIGGQFWKVLLKGIHNNILKMEEEGKARISFRGQVFDTAEALKIIFSMSFFKVGDQSIHLNFVQDYLVTKHKWLSESSFKEIRDLCWNLPGPTIQQIPLTIVILKTKSISSGLKCFFIYNMVPWTLIGLISILVNVFNFTKDSLSEGWSIIFLGCNAAVAGLMMRSFLTFTSHFLWNWPKMLLILTTTVLFIIFQSSTVLIFCMIFSGLVSLYLQVEEHRKKMSLKSQNLFKNIDSSRLLGRYSALSFLGLFFLLWIFFSIYPENHYLYVFGFYLVGSLIIGPIQSVFAYYLAIFSSIDQFQNFHLWIALPISFILPGSHMNMGIFFGAMIDGFRGAVLAAIFMYLPCFLSLFGLLPEWRSYRDRQGIRRLYEGLTCSTTGLTLAIIVLTLKSCIELDISTSLCVFLVSSFLTLMVPRYAFLVVLLGGFLAFMRYISLKCYRYGVYCPFPFNF